MLRGFETGGRNSEEYEHWVTLSWVRILAPFLSGWWPWTHYLKSLCLPCHICTTGMRDGRYFLGLLWGFSTILCVIESLACVVSHSEKAFSDVSSCWWFLVLLSSSSFSWLLLPPSESRPMCLRKFPFFSSYTFYTLVFTPQAIHWCLPSGKRSTGDTKGTR